MGDTVLEVRDLHTHFFLRRGVVKAVDGVSFSLRRGEVLGLVGESGCGKTLTALSLMRLLPKGGARTIKGEVLLDGENILERTPAEMREIRGRRISMVLQDPQTSLNPVFSIGDQLREAIVRRLPGKSHMDPSDADRAQAKPESIALGIAGLLEPALMPPHLLATRLPGATPPTPIDKLLGDIASSKDSAEVTPEFRATFPGPRRELIAGMLKVIQTWTLLGCESVRGRGISRLRSRIEHICYAKGTAGKGNLLFTVLYESGWRAAGLDNVFGL